MKNCLVTKLNGVVNNDNLEKFGVLRFTVASGTGANPIVQVRINGEHIINVLNTDEYVVSAWGSCSKIDNHTVKCTGTDVGGFVMSEECVVMFEILDKYDITYILISNVSAIKDGINTLYSTLKSLDLVNTTMAFDTADFKKFSNIERLNLYSSFTSFIGSLNDLAGLYNLQYFTANNARNTITGDISVLGGLTSLNVINLSGNNTITGTLESFVAAQRSNGRTTEDTGIDFAWGLPGITFNGAAINRTHNCTLTWTADSITYDGVTINA